MNITVICIGKLKEKYWRDAVAEYEKRLNGYCSLKILELKEEDFDEIIKRAITEANPAYPVPQEWGPKKFRRLLNALLVKER